MTFEPALPDQAKADTSEIPPILAWIEAHSGPGPAAQPPAAGVMPAGANERAIDLSGSNHLSGLLWERSALMRDMRSIQNRLGEIDRAVKAAMGDAAIGMLPGWTIHHELVHRKEHFVHAATYRRLVIKPAGDA